MADAERQPTAHRGQDGGSEWPAVAKTTLALGGLGGRRVLLHRPPEPLPGGQQIVAARKASDADVRAQAFHAPLLPAARVRLAQRQRLAETELCYRHEKPAAARTTLIESLRRSVAARAASAKSGPFEAKMMPRDELMIARSPRSSVP